VPKYRQTNFCSSGGQSLEANLICRFISLAILLIYKNIFFYYIGRNKFSNKYPFSKQNISWKVLSIFRQKRKELMKTKYHAMSPATTAIIVVAAAVLTGLGYYFIVGSKNSSSQESTDTSNLNSYYEYSPTESATNASTETDFSDSYTDTATATASPTETGTSSSLTE